MYFNKESHIGWGGGMGKPWRTCKNVSFRLDFLFCPFAFNSRAFKFLRTLSSLTTFSPVQAPVLVAQSCLFATSWTVARQAPLSMELSRQDYWSDYHSLLQGIFPTQGVKQPFIENLFLLGTVISLIWLSASLRLLPVYVDFFVTNLL